MIGEGMAGPIKGVVVTFNGWCICWRFRLPGPDWRDGNGDREFSCTCSTVTSSWDALQVSIDCESPVLTFEVLSSKESRMPSCSTRSKSSVWEEISWLWETHSWLTSLPSDFSGSGLLSVVGVVSWEDWGDCEGLRPLSLSRRFFLNCRQNTCM